MANKRYRLRPAPAKPSPKNANNNTSWLLSVCWFLLFLYYFMIIYAFPKWAMYKARHHQDIYPAYACNMIQGKYNEYSVEIEGETYYGSDVELMWFGKEKNSIPFLTDPSGFYKDIDKYMNKNNCFKIKYIQLWEWRWISYKKIYLYDYIP